MTRKSGDGVGGDLDRRPELFATDFDQHPAVLVILFSTCFRYIYVLNPDPSVKTSLLSAVCVAIRS